MKHLRVWGLLGLLLVGLVAGVAMWLATPPVQDAHCRDARMFLRRVKDAVALQAEVAPTVSQAQLGLDGLVKVDPYLATLRHQIDDKWRLSSVVAADAWVIELIPIDGATNCKEELKLSISVRSN